MDKKKYLRRNELCRNNIAEIRKTLLFKEHIFTGVAGQNMIRLLPPLTLTLDEADIFLNSFRNVLADFEAKEEQTQQTLF